MFWWLIGIGVVFNLALYGVSVLWKHLTKSNETAVECNTYARTAVKNSMGNKRGALFYGVPLYALLEEILFRGLLFVLPVSLFDWSLWSCILFGLISTLLWILAHILTIQPPVYTYSQFLGSGVMFCLFAIATHSILLGVLVHTLMNTILFIGLKLYDREHQETVPEPDFSVPDSSESL